MPTADGPQLTKGEKTRAAILSTAARAFRDRGYDTCTLEDIAHELGITRSAVLHHFATKDEILRQVVTPFLTDLDEVLDDMEASRPGSTPMARRSVVTKFVELAAKHRPVAAVLARDVTAHAHLGSDLQIEGRAARFVAILAADAPGPAAVTRGLAALGAVLRPLVSPESVVDFDDPFTRGVLVECVIAVFESPDPPAEPAD